jgi:hypothetical protein
MKYRISVFLAAFQIATAAGPVTHLYLGEQYCALSGASEEETGEFLVGTLLPDIRYVACCSREKTHIEVADLQEVAESASTFEAGMKFHMWVDVEREAFVEDSGIYDFVRLHAEGHEATLLKFIEEEVLAGFYDGQKWSFLFDEIRNDELFFATEDHIARWHSMIQYTMAYRISWLIWGASYIKERAFGISDETLYAWSYLIPELAQTPLFQDHVKNLLFHLETKFVR